MKKQRETPKTAEIINFCGTCIYMTKVISFSVKKRPILGYCEKQKIAKLLNLENCEEYDNN